jgi:hypothetical protein
MKIKVLDPRLRGDDKLISAAISRKSLNHEKHL